MFGYIYKTTNLIDGKCYIGKKTSSKFDPSYLGSGINIAAAIKKYGRKNFAVEMLCECQDKYDLNEKEKFFIEQFNAARSPNFYNISVGGDGGNTYEGKTEEELNKIKSKISAANRGDKNGNHGQYVGQLNSMYGKHHSMESRIKRSNTIKQNIGKRTTRGCIASQITRQKLREAAKRYISLWTITTNSFTLIVLSKRRTFIKLLMPDIYNNISKLQWLYLKSVGKINVAGIDIAQRIIDLNIENIDCYKKYQFDKNKLKNFKALIGVSTIENTSESEMTEMEVSRVGI